MKYEFKEVLTSSLQVDPKNARHNESLDPADPSNEVISLANSIAEVGLINPIEVDQDGIIISGHRRYAALMYLGEKKAQVKVIQINSEQSRLLRQLIENLHRRDLAPLDTANALQRLKELSGWNDATISDHVHLARATVTDLLALLGETNDILTAIGAGKLPYTNVTEANRFPSQYKGRVKERLLKGELSGQRHLKVMKSAVERVQSSNPDLANEIIEMDLPENLEKATQAIHKIAPIPEKVDNERSEMNQRIVSAVRELDYALKAMHPRFADSETKFEIASLMKRIEVWTEQSKNDKMVEIVKS